MNINKKVLESYLRHAKTALVMVVVLVLGGAAKFQSSGGVLKFNRHTILAIGAIVLIPLVQVWYQTIVKKRPDLAPEATFVEAKVLTQLNTLAGSAPIGTAPPVSASLLDGVPTA